MSGTKAGRALLDGLSDALGTTSDSALGTHGEMFRERIVEAVERGVLAIEAEVEERIATAVRALPSPDPTFPGGYYTADMVSRAAVLAITEEKL